jgi:hypothetical protein
MNRYKIKFMSICPVNGDKIEYSLEINSCEIIMVEILWDVVDGFKKGFHEEFADVLHAKFGGKQFMSAVHGGVLIETERG